MNKEFYQMSVEECFEQLNSNKNGLSTQMAEEIKGKVGSNVIPKKKIGFYKKYIKPVFNMMIIILLICAAVQYILGETLSAYIIFTIIFLNILIAFAQQIKVDKTLKTLEKLTAFKCTVLRDGKATELDSDLIVPGDIILLNQGDYISADCRLFDANDLSMDESVLTGEPIAIEKTTDALQLFDIQIQEQKNMVFSSTFVASGTGKAIVVKTGLQTEIGKITKGVAEKEHRDIPLQKNMNRLASGLGLLVLIIVIILFSYAMIIGTSDPVKEVSWLVSLAVAAIPFNFPIIITIILLSGVLKLAKKQAIVRNLNSIETMGRLDYICSDKTGTLTKNQMTVNEIYYNDKTYLFSGQGYMPEGELTLDEQKINMEEDPLFGGLFLNAIINNNSRIIEEEVNIRNGTKKIRRIIGMPTEGALLVAAEKAGFVLQHERNSIDVLKEISFSSDRKRMSKIIKKDEETLCFMKGAPEKVLELCSHWVESGGIQLFSNEIKENVMEKIEKFASQGKRTLAFAFRHFEGNLTKEMLDNMGPEEIEQQLIFLGVAAIIDPPREGVRNSVKVCNDAGIKVTMITGDHPTTAKSIAKMLNIYNEGDKIAIGNEIKKMTPEEIENTSVFARVAPEDKVDIVLALQSKGHCVGMTGDGVNDVLALENADVGIAMGISGTDVAKNSADLILTDDSFITIENALYNGRGLFNNIRANIVFLLVCNLLELAILTTIKLGYNQELFLQYQLLILYSTVHFFPPFGLMFDKYHEDLMKKPPKQQDEPILNKEYKIFMGVLIITTIIIVFILWFLIRSGVFAVNQTNLREITNIDGGYGYFQPPLPEGTDTGALIDPSYVTVDFLIQNFGLDVMKDYKARTIIFLTVIFSEIWIALEARSINLSMFKCKRNIGLYVLLGIVFFITIGIQFSDIALCYLVLIPLALNDWLIAFGFSLIVILVAELYKKYLVK